MANSAKDHQPGAAPDKGTRDARGVQQFTNRQKAAAEPECPGNMIFDPGTGECIAADREG